MEPMTRQEIEKKIIEVARRISIETDSDCVQRLAGRLEVLFEQLNAITRDCGNCKHSGKRDIQCTTCLRSSMWQPKEEIK